MESCHSPHSPLYRHCRKLRGRRALSLRQVVERCLMQCLQLPHFHPCNRHDTWVAVTFTQHTLHKYAHSVMKPPKYWGEANAKIILNPTGNERPAELLPTSSGHGNSVALRARSLRLSPMCKECAGIVCTYCITEIILNAFQFVFVKVSYYQTLVL